MARSAVLSGLIDAAIDELKSHSPFSMARLAEYGKVGGYSSDYLGLKRDVLTLCRGLAVVAPGFDDRPLRRLPEPTLRRTLVEEFFLDERAALIGALADAQAALRAADPELVDRNWAQLERPLAARIERLIADSGVGTALPPPDPEPFAPDRSDGPIDPPARAAPAHQAARAAEPPPAPEPPLSAARGGPAIYVSSRFAPELGEQISAFLAMRGLHPITPTLSGAELGRGLGAGGGRAAGARRGAAAVKADLSRAEAAMRGCAGGFLSLVLPTDDARGLRAAPSLSDALTLCLPEVAAAQRHLGRRMVIIARQDMVSALPEQLRAHPIFALENVVMNEREFSTFVSMASRTSWLRA